MAQIHTYNPRKVTVSLGSHIVTGYADDSMINIEYAGDGTSVIVGADGEVTRTIDPSKMYNFKLALQQNSKTNEFLQKCYDKDQVDGSGTFPINVNDLLGKEKFVGEIAWVSKPAAWGRGKASTNREWEIVVGEGNFA